MIRRAAAAGIQTDLIAVDSRKNGEAMPTGTAFITVDPRGKNAIVVVPGAATLLSNNGAALVRRLVAPESDGYPVWREAKVVLASTEVGAVAVAAAFAAAPEGATRIWNPAPVPSTGVREILAHTDILIPNEREAAQLVGDPDRVIDTVAAAEQVANEVVAKYGDVFAGILIVTLGELGAVIRRPDGSFSHVTTPHGTEPLTVVDTTGAGDSFCGAFAVASLRHPLDLAVRAACTVASVSVTGRGTQSSYASRERFAEFFP
jgi:ribokinase